MNIEKILRIEVTHTPHNHKWNEPARIQVIGYTEQGQFTIRRIEGLSTARIVKKINLMRKTFEQLVGTNVKISERKFYRGEFREPSVHRLVVPASLPDWARGDWEKVAMEE